MKLAIIPARGGSKRIPRKNIKLFHGKPIIAYSIETALSSQLFDQVIVSTDDEEIATIARDCGAAVPFTRPDFLSNDYASTNDVIKHAIEWVQAEKGQVSMVCCLYATAPFIRKDDLLTASKLLIPGIHYVFSVTEYAYPVGRSFYLTSDNKIQMLWPENFNKRSQDLSKVFHDAGMFYFGKAEAFLNNEPIFGVYSIPYILPHYRVQDIDNLDDWFRAEKYYKVLEEIDQ